MGNGAVNHGLRQNSVTRSLVGFRGFGLPLLGVISVLLDNSSNINVLSNPSSVDKSGSAYCGHGR